MNRMKFHHHKFALTITIFFVAIIGVALGLQIDKASQGGSGILIMLFGFLMVLLVITFIMLSMLLRMRDEMHDIHESLRSHVTTHFEKHSASMQRGSKK